MATNWWKQWPVSPPLDQEAEYRHKRRVGRMQDVVFQGACELAGIKPTPRQARKWNNGKGLALSKKNMAKEEL